jgi:hypothetical protein
MSSQHSNHWRETLGVSRRQFLEAGGAGMAALAGSGFLGTNGFLGRNSAHALAATTAKSPRAKSVVILYLYGAPSQMDTLDPKPLAPVDPHVE